MREFDFKASAAKLLTNDIVNMLGYIHEYKGQQNLFIEAKADVLSHLLEIAKIQSDRGADIVKIVAAASSERELYEIFETTARLKNEIEKPFLFLCVGEYCKKHRLTAPIIINGIYLCVAEQDEFSTPAQPLLKTAKAMTNLIYGG